MRRDYLRDQKYRSGLSRLVRGQVRKQLLKTDRTTGGILADSSFGTKALRIAVSFLAVLLAGGAVNLDRDAGDLKAKTASSIKSAMPAVADAEGLPPSSTGALIQVLDRFEEIMSRGTPVPPGAVKIVERYSTERETEVSREIFQSRGGNTIVGANPSVADPERLTESINNLVEELRRQYPGNKTDQEPEDMERIIDELANLAQSLAVCRTNCCCQSGVPATTVPLSVKVDGELSLKGAIPLQPPGEMRVTVLLPARGASGTDRGSRGASGSPTTTLVAPRAASEPVRSTGPYGLWGVRLSENEWSSCQPASPAPFSVQLKVERGKFSARDCAHPLEIVNFQGTSGTTETAHTDDGGGAPATTAATGSSCAGANASSTAPCAAFHDFAVYYIQKERPSAIVPAFLRGSDLYDFWLIPKGAK